MHFIPTYTKSEITKCLGTTHPANFTAKKSKINLFLNNNNTNNDRYTNGISQKDCKRWAALKKLPESQLYIAGRSARLLIEESRRLYLEAAGFATCFVQYCPDGITPDNVLLLAKRRGCQHSPLSIPPTLAHDSLPEEGLVLHAGRFTSRFGDQNTGYTNGISQKDCKRWAALKKLPESQLYIAGRSARLLIEESRRLYLEAAGFATCFVQYCPDGITPDNVLLLAKRRGCQHSPLSIPPTLAHDSLPEEGLVLHAGGNQSLSARIAEYLLEHRAGELKRGRPSAIESVHLHVVQLGGGVLRAKGKPAPGDSPSAKRPRVEPADPATSPAARPELAMVVIVAGAAASLIKLVESLVLTKAVDLVVPFNRRDKTVEDLISRCEESLLNQDAPVRPVDSSRRYRVCCAPRSLESSLQAWISPEAKRNLSPTAFTDTFFAMGYRSREGHAWFLSGSFPRSVFDVREWRETAARPPVIGGAPVVNKSDRALVLLLNEVEERFAAAAVKGKSVVVVCDERRGMAAVAAALLQHGAASVRVCPATSAGDADGGKSGEKCGDTSGEKCGGKSGEKCGDTSGEKCGGKIGEKCGDTSGEKCGGKIGEKCGDTSGEKCGGKIGEKCGDTSGEKCGETSGAKNGEKSGEKSGAIPSEASTLGGAGKAGVLGANAQGETTEVVGSSDAKAQGEAGKASNAKAGAKRKVYTFGQLEPGAEVVFFVLERGNAAEVLQNLAGLVHPGAVFFGRIKLGAQARARRATERLAADWKDRGFGKVFVHHLLCDRDSDRTLSSNCDTARTSDDSNNTNNSSNMVAQLEPGAEVVFFVLERGNAAEVLQNLAGLVHPGAVFFGRIKLGAQARARRATERLAADWKDHGFGKVFVHHLLCDRDSDRTVIAQRLQD
ncbi:hypothetical protein DIPPA_06787 [Diplonema papillatum]|nr:hypothetical protein DIPPA_06787 [Diplonema papillatum]